MHIWLDEQIKGQLNGWTIWWMDGRMDIDRQFGGWMDEWTEKCIDSLNGWMNGRMEKLDNGWRDG